MHCTLLVPDLLLPPVPDASLYRDLHLPALTRLLARGRIHTLAALSMEAWLCQAFEVARQRDWPVAPLTLTIDGADPGGAYWLRCDPVHLHVHRSQLLLADVAPTPDETAALIAAFNSHFSHDGLAFSARHPGRWYLRLGSAPALATHALAEVTGKDINRYLPEGDDRLRWHQRLNEIQMLLHAHPVNHAREALNQPAINSVWLWGGGVRPTLHGRHFSRVWSDDALALALAAASDTPARGLPCAATALFDAAADDVNDQLAVLPQLRNATSNADFDSWGAGMRALERDWFAPLQEALRRRALSHLTLVALGANRCLRCDISAGDLWKFWRPLRPLAHHA